MSCRRPVGSGRTATMSQISCTLEDDDGLTTFSKIRNDGDEVHTCPVLLLVKE
jgi:hypothetical protein